MNLSYVQNKGVMSSKVTSGSTWCVVLAVYMQLYVKRHTPILSLNLASLGCWCVTSKVLYLDCVDIEALSI